MRKELGKGKNILTTRRADKVYALKSICRISREAKKKVREEGEGRGKKAVGERRAFISGGCAMIR